MSKGWEYSIKAGILGVVAFFIPAYFIYWTDPMGGYYTPLSGFYWYWGLISNSIGGIYLTSFNISPSNTIVGSTSITTFVTSPFRFTVGILGIVSAIILIILGILSRSGKGNTWLWILFGAILIYLPFTEYFYELRWGTFQNLGVTPILQFLQDNIIIFPIAPFFFIISGILAIISGIKFHQNKR